MTRVRFDDLNESADRKARSAKMNAVATGGPPHPSSQGISREPYCNTFP